MCVGRRWIDRVGEKPRTVVRRVTDPVACPRQTRQRRGFFGLTLRNRVQDLRMLGPDRFAILPVLQNFAHCAAQMIPEMAHGVDEQAISRLFVDEHMEIHIGAD